MDVHLLLKTVYVCSVWNCKAPATHSQIKHGFTKHLPAFQLNGVGFRKKGNPRIIMHICGAELGIQCESSFELFSIGLGNLLICGAGGDGDFHLQGKLHTPQGIYSFHKVFLWF